MKLKINVISIYYHQLQLPLKLVAVGSKTVENTIVWNTANLIDAIDGLGIECPACHGSGFDDYEQVCYVCSGTGEIGERK